MSTIKVAALALLFLAIAVTWVPLCHAMQSRPATLGEVFSLAWDSEPHYLSAKADLAAARARKHQAVGALLPHIDITANRKFHHRKYKTHASFPPTMRDQYLGEGARLELKQPIWNYADIVTLREARQNMQQAQLLLADAKQQLFARVANAWFDLLEADDAVQVARARQMALRAKAKIAQHGSKLGLRGGPQADAARAKFLKAKADVLASEMDQQTKLAVLEQLIGSADDIHPPPLRMGVDIPDLIGNNLDALLVTAMSTNPALLAAHRAVTAANTDVSKQHAGYQPTLDLVASYGNNNQTVGNFPGQSGYSIHDYYVGLQLNIPLYEGGTQSAKVSEAIAQRDKTHDKMRVTRRKVQLDIKTAYFSWHANRARAKAAVMAVNANQVLLKQARAGMRHGLETHADALEARQHWIEARSDWRKACYEQLRAYAKLRATLGDLTVADAIDIDRLFSASYSTSRLKDNDLAPRAAPGP